MVGTGLGRGCVELSTAGARDEVLVVRAPAAAAEGTSDASTGETSTAVTLHLEERDTSRPAASWRGRDRDPAVTAQRTGGAREAQVHAGRRQMVSRSQSPGLLESAGSAAAPYAT